MIEIGVATTALVALIAAAWIVTLRFDDWPINRSREFKVSKNVAGVIAGLLFTPATLR